MTTKLSQIVVNEVSLVTKGANRKRYAITKSALNGAPVLTQENVMTEEQKVELEKAHTEALAKADADLKAVQAKLEALEKAAADEKAVALEKAAVEKAALEKALAAEVEAKELAEVIQKAAVDFKNLPSKAEDLGPALRVLRKADAAAASKIEAVLKSVDAMLAQALDARGTSNAADVADAWSAIEKKAREIVAKADNKLTFPQAVDFVCKTDGDLYNAYQTEQRSK